ncbi:hypothetical protein HDU84_005381 [Entophlyctis sp. JEL0112]|nr:hypothetical protein HDU84_005381 [Entophlyctis sp. JEL0112]
MASKNPSAPRTRLPHLQQPPSRPVICEPIVPVLTTHPLLMADTYSGNANCKAATALALVTPPKEAPTKRFMPAPGGADWAAGIPGLVPLADTFSSAAALPASVTFITSAVQYPPITKLHCAPRLNNVQPNSDVQGLENEDDDLHQGDFPTPNPSPFKGRRKAIASPAKFTTNTKISESPDNATDLNETIKHNPSFGGRQPSTTSPAQEHDAMRLLHAPSFQDSEDILHAQHQPPRRQNALAAKAQALAIALENLKVERAQEAERLVQLLRSREGALGSYGAELRRFVAPPPQQPQLQSAEGSPQNSSPIGGGKRPGRARGVSGDPSNNLEQHENLDHKMPLSVVMERAAAMGKIPIGVAREVIRELELANEPKPTDQVKSEPLDNIVVANATGSNYAAHHSFAENAQTPPALIKRPRGRPRGSGRKRTKSDIQEANQVENIKMASNLAPTAEFVERSSKEDAAFLLSAAAALSQQGAERDLSAGLDSATVASSPASVAVSGTLSASDLQKNPKSENEQPCTVSELSGLDWLVLAARM